MEKYENVKKPLKEILINNFFGGIAWALGATAGLSIIIGILSLVSKQISLVPFIGKFVTDVIDFINKTNPNLIK